MPYGLLSNVDIQSLEGSIRLAHETFPAQALTVVEIGICHGDTSRGIRDYLNGLGVAFSYHGFDSQRDKQISPPFEGASLHLGDSAEIYHEAPEGIHWLMIDGCHCVNHMMLDFLHFGDRVAKGGVAIFHDVSPLSQNKCDYQGHGPNIADFGTACREGIRKLGLYDGFRTDWVLIKEDWEPNLNWGGVAVFQKQ